MRISILTIGLTVCGLWVHDKRLSGLMRRCLDIDYTFWNFQYIVFLFNFY